jgi:iron complex transport system permease protein
MVATDIVARVLFAPAEIPIGVITAVCGAPFFLYLLRKRMKSIF